MNTNSLAKLYDRLTPTERLPLILAASGRGDEAERNRLAQSAPKEAFRLPDYHGRAEGLIFASVFQLLEMLDLTVRYWQAGGLMADWEAVLEEEQGEPRRRLRAAMKVFAYILTIKLAGWRRFCSEFNIDPEFLMKDLPGFAIVQRTEESARIMACTPDEATAWMQKRGGETAKMPTVEDEAASLWDFVDSKAKRWS